MDPGEENSENDQVSARRSSLERLLWRGMAILAGAGWLLGTLLQWTVRDRFSGVLAALFYATPLPLVILAGSVAGFAWRRGLACRADRSKSSSSSSSNDGSPPTGAMPVRVRRVFVLIVFCQAVFWLTASLSLTSHRVPDDAIRIAFWNVNRGFRGYDGIATELLAHDADVLALVEATQDGQQKALWQNLCPGYSVQTTGSGMTLLVRGSVEIVESGRSKLVSRWRLLRVTTCDRSFLLVLVDIASHPLWSRQPAFDDVTRLLRRFDNEPVLIAGDFNTPTNSVCYDELRNVANNSFESAGEGHRETWPVVLPVMALDQIWGNGRIKWHRSWHGWSARSDHRPVIAEFSLIEASEK